jgi:fatty-acyl-CoA synthase
VAVIGIDDDEFGQRLKAFVVLHERDSLGEDELKEHVKRNLARYKVPREIVRFAAAQRDRQGAQARAVLTLAAA